MVFSDVLGFQMLLEPSEIVDGSLLFYPHLYDRKEIAYMKRVLKRGSTFFDIGAHIGFYSLVASSIVGPEGRIVSVDADPYNFSKLAKNLEYNKISNVNALNYGVSDCREVRRLGINTFGNRGGNSFLGQDLREGVDVQCYTLEEICEMSRSTHIDGLKIDIEGFEHRVLERFFQNAAKSLYPRFIITESNPAWVDPNFAHKQDLSQLLEDYGYKIISSTHNLIAEYR